MGFLEETSMSAIKQVSKLLQDITMRVWMLPVSACKSMWKIGRENPRRVIHALKVGLALTLVSLLYLLEPLYEIVGQNAMWAVMTVGVVLEYTAGATLCKGLNRGFGTLCAGLLAFLMEEVAEESGKTLHAFFIGASVFVVGFATTYLRFLPSIKKNYDYGVLIFLLTFNLITVSSYRVKDILGLARSRLYTIAIGCSVCLIMSLFILPNWSGEDLHNSTAYKLESLARSIRACVEVYFQDTDADEIADDRKPAVRIDEDYRAILDSKAIDEALAQFASWEPRCTRDFHKYPWKRYVTLGALLRHFGYTAVALHGCLDSHIQAPKSIRRQFREPCTEVAKEASKVLAALSYSMKNYRRFSPDTLRDCLHDALQVLNSAIKSQPRLFLGSKRSNKLKAHGKSEKSTKAISRVGLSSFKSDVSALSEWSKRAENSSVHKQLRTIPSKISISSPEFSEALPFAAFCSLLVEMVARLDLVIEEMDKLGKAANFKEFSARDHDVDIDLSHEEKGGNKAGGELHEHHLGSHADGF